MYCKQVQLHLEDDLEKRLSSTPPDSGSTDRLPPRRRERPNRRRKALRSYSEHCRRRGSTSSSPRCPAVASNVAAPADRQSDQNQTAVVNDGDEAIQPTKPHSLIRVRRHVWAAIGVASTRSTQRDHLPPPETAA